MSFQQPQMQTKRPVLVFLKQVGAPVVLYVDDTEAAYNELKEIMKKASNASPKLIEKIGKGPVKKLAIMDTQIAGLAIQEETFMG